MVCGGANVVPVPPSPNVSAAHVTPSPSVTGAAEPAATRTVVVPAVVVVVVATSTEASSAIAPASMVVGLLAGPPLARPAMKARAQASVAASSGVPGGMIGPTSDPARRRKSTLRSGSPATTSVPPLTADTPTVRLPNPGETRSSPALGPLAPWQPAHADEAKTAAMSGHAGPVAVASVRGARYRSGASRLPSQAASESVVAKATATAMGLDEIRSFKRSSWMDA